MIPRLSSFGIVFCRLVGCARFIKSSAAKQWLLVQRVVLHEAVTSPVFPGIEVMQSKLINIFTCCEIRSCCKSVINTFLRITKCVYHDEYLGPPSLSSIRFVHGYMLMNMTYIPKHWRLIECVICIWAFWLTEKSQIAVCLESHNITPSGSRIYFGTSCRITARQ